MELSSFLSEIAWEGMSKMSELKRVTYNTLGGTWVTMGGYAVSQCPNLESFEIYGFHSLSYHVFTDCTSLTSITIQNSMETFRGISINANYANNSGDFVIHCSNGDIAKADVLG